MRRSAARGLAGVGSVAIGLLATAGTASAHPLGNVSVNHYAGLVVGTDEIRVDYVLDLAELPTVRERQIIDADGDDVLDDAERVAYEERRCQELAAGVDLRIEGRAAALRATTRALDFLDGTAGLTTMRLECELRTDAGVTEHGTTLELRDENPGERGWREVTAVGDGVTLEESTVPEVSVSSRLAEYPDGETLDVSTARVVASPGGTAAPALGPTPFGERARAATDRFTSLVAADEVTVPLVATSLVVATLFGALHSLAPGHGKSVIAAYLLGHQRDRRLAFLLGGTVAVTHTASVLVFGGIISLTETATPEEFYPVFGVVSGLLFVALGAALLRQVVSRGRTSWERPASLPPVLVTAPAGGAPDEIVLDHGHVVLGHHDHEHPHDHPHHHDHQHGHDHGGGWHEHEHVDLGAVASGDLGWRGVVLPGLAGGVIPSPSALLVFLGGLALGRGWFGVGLVLGYGVGIAATLVTAGWLLARAGDRVTGRGALDRYPRLARAAAYLPAATAVLVIAGGVHIALRAVV